MPAVTDNCSTSANLTVTFAPGSLGTCATNGNSTGSAVTFSTSGAAANQTCFNLNETFDTSASTPYWSIANAAGFDPSANYSRIWYQQVNITGKVGSGKVATQFLQLYPEYGCSEASDYVARPTYGMSCQSGVDGECNSAPHSIASFSVSHNAFEDGGKCLDFKNEESAAAGLAPGAWTTLVVLLVTAGFAAL